MKDNRITGFYLAGFAILLFVALFGLSFAVSYAPNEVKLPIIAIAGVLLLLGALAVVSVAFSLFELSDKTQALGLPEGSIRAVIALSLIVLFAIFSVYLYSSLIGQSPSSPNADFAKQLLVLIGTLVTAGATSPLEIRGDRLDLVKEVKIVFGSNQVVASDVVSNASTVRCQLELPL